MNPDRKARLQFVVRALSSDPAERDRFFASLADVANRRHEPWVLDGLRYLHHPLRAASAVKYIDPSLKLLQEIQQTGDIFPTHWMGATLGGHRSPESAAIVRDSRPRAALVSRSPAPHHPLGGGRPLPREPECVSALMEADDLAVPDGLTLDLDSATASGWPSGAFS